MRRFVLVLTVGAMMAALLAMTANPALADHRDRGTIIFVDRDRDFDRGFFFDRSGRFGGFGQNFDQDATSGDVNISYRATNTGNNSNVATPALQFGNTGNLQNQQGFSSFGGSVDDVEFDGGGFVFEPSLQTDVNQAVQQSAAASSSWWWW